MNSAALRDARITRRTAAPDAGEIVHDRHGNPTGVVKGSAIDLVRARLPRATADERADALRRAIADAHERGVTSVRESAPTPEDLDLYTDARRSGELKLRVNAPAGERNTTIKPGTLADLVVLSRDVKDAPAPSLGDTPVEVTVFDGKIVYKRKI